MAPRYYHWVLLCGILVLLPAERCLVGVFGSFVIWCALLIHFLVHVLVAHLDVHKGVVCGLRASNSWWSRCRYWYIFELLAWICTLFLVFIDLLIDNFDRILILDGQIYFWGTALLISLHFLLICFLDIGIWLAYLTTGESSGWHIGPIKLADHASRSKDIFSTDDMAAGWLDWVIIAVVQVIITL